MRGYIESIPGLKGLSFREKWEFGVQDLHGSGYTKSELIRVHGKIKGYQVELSSHIDALIMPVGTSDCETLGCPENWKIHKVDDDILHKL